MDELYRENILDHYKHPRNRGTLEHPDITSEDANPLCGDQLRMDIEVKDGKIEQVRFSGHGCSISQAAASMLCEQIEGKTLEEVQAARRATTCSRCWASSWGRCGSSARCSRSRR